MGRSKKSKTDPVVAEMDRRLADMKGDLFEALLAAPSEELPSGLRAKLDATRGLLAFRASWVEMGEPAGEP